VPAPLDFWQISARVLRCRHNLRISPPPASPPPLPTTNRVMVCPCMSKHRADRRNAAADAGEQG